MQRDDLLIADRTNVQIFTLLPSLLPSSFHLLAVNFSWYFCLPVHKACAYVLLVPNAIANGQLPYPQRQHWWEGGEGWGGGG